MERVKKLETKLRQDLFGKKDYLKIEEKLKELMELGNRSHIEIGPYTHSISHLFDPQTCANGTTIMDINSNISFLGTELVNYTIKRALKNDYIGSIQYLIDYISNFNLKHMEENLHGFAFKPEMLHHKYLIEAASNNEEFCKDILIFCEVDSIKDYCLQCNLLKKPEEISPDAKIVPGIFVDVENTLLFEFLGNYDINFDLQNYLLKKIEDGTTVTVFSGDPSILKQMEKAGLDKKLLNVKNKKDFEGKTLEVVIDDRLPILQGFRAKTYYASIEEVSTK